MGLKKKKNVIILSCCMVACFILYQLYFFLTITSEANNNIVVPVLDYKSVVNLLHLRSEDDKYINEHGMIRGIYYADLKNYRPDSNKEFKCKTSHQKIPFERLNDDFCDCEDGTDEPSTTACPDGIFYCDTQSPRKQSLSIPSSKVNDGICDCCDGSDEWMHSNSDKLLSQSSPKHYRFYVAKCPNNCNK
ncbi:uncharacterized protein LOC126773036 [Nymphalis io]|uniref:uncharacterized protein LOC126773036 n=1 Tax=Inachis io TaxID=171585 RepID=UPI00216A8265|nr:uncharacterized protein LOC126773036 [Nymphalis io]